MALSTDTLFHFSKKESIMDILKSRLFWPIYNLETFTNEYTFNHKYAIPMVCFCDLDFQLTEYHQKNYGSYAIGLKKSWAIVNRLNPVSYQLEQSSFTSANENLAQLLSMLMKNSTNDEILGIEDEYLVKEVMNCEIKSEPLKYLLHKFLITIHAFKKPYSYNGINYYDEREWRYIPNLYPDNILEYETIANDYHKLIIDEIIYNNYTLKKRYQDYIIANYSLKFNENDISTIIVESAKDVLEMRERLKEDYTEDFLKNRIQTYEEVDGIL